MSSGSLQAYGPTGHRVIAAIAEKHLTPQARTAVDAILGDTFMAEAAFWPDEMKSSPDPFWRTESYTYHFINFPDGVTYEESEKNPAGDAYTALEKYTAVLKDTTAAQEERYKALAFVLHIVGDLHQPLHAGRAEDWGGNKIQVVWFEEMTNLHMVWDEHLIDHKKLSYSEWTAFLDKKITPEEIAVWQNSTPLTWVHELAAMRGDIYANGKGILSWDYVYQNTPLLKSQLSKGGIRLAGYLNAIFK
ncbi:S1/P1 nuclease [Kordiimonas pumila]|uniref:S1/P1 nuclease n=1 Tax=Kordiimonas pumila TaxID=2161677 RepID=A0ABV7DA62_9PROT|nr:S1/P1 nuclease [Kordiimonas pumila]